MRHRRLDRFPVTYAANERTLTYTANGQLFTLTDAEINKTTYVYDGHDGLAKITVTVHSKPTVPDCGP